MGRILKYAGNLLGLLYGKHELCEAMILHWCHNLSKSWSLEPIPGARPTDIGDEVVVIAEHQVKDGVTMIGAPQRRRNDFGDKQNKNKRK